MRKEQIALALAVAGVAAVAALAATWALLAPERLGTAIVGALTLPLLWGLIELAAREGRASIRFAVVAGAAVLALFLGFRVAQAAGWIAPGQGEVALKAFGMTSGLVLAFFGNRIPKMLERFDPTIDVAQRQAFQRMAGWVFVLTGLAVTAVWLILPVDQAALCAALVVAGGTLLVLARLVRCHFRGKNA